MVPSCTTCGQTMTPLFHPSWFCSTCENPAKAKDGWKKLPGTAWLYVVVPRGKSVPQDATHGWWTSSTRANLEEWLVSHSKTDNNFPWVGKSWAPEVWMDMKNVSGVSVLVAFKKG